MSTTTTTARFKGYKANEEMATFSERLKAAMNRKGIATSRGANPAAALHKLWLKAYGDVPSGDLNYISRITPHDWLKSEKKVASIDAHRLMLLADLLGVSSRWLLRGNHLGHVNMEPVIGMSQEEIRLLEGFRQLGPVDQIRLMERLKTLTEDHVAPQFQSHHVRQETEKK